MERQSGQKSGSVLWRIAACIWTLRRVFERWNERSSERSNERSIERSNERSLEHSIERSNKRSIERSNKRILVNVRAHSDSSACSEVCAVRTFGSVTHGRRDCRSRCKRTFERSFERTLERSLEHSNTRRNTPQYAARFFTTLAFHNIRPNWASSTLERAR